MAAQGPERDTFLHKLNEDLSRDIRENGNYSPDELIEQISETYRDGAIFIKGELSRGGMRTLPQAEQQRWLEWYLVLERGRSGVSTLRSIANPPGEYVRGEVFRRRRGTQRLPTESPGLSAAAGPNRPV